jgi:hypothetical protein
VNVLNKNTTRKSDDNYKPKKDRSLRLLTFAVIAFFAGIMLCIGCYSITLLNIYELSKLLAIFAVIGFLIPLKYYQKWFHFIKYEVIIFNILGMCPFLTGLFLLLNFMFATNPYTHDYRVEKIYFEGEENYKSIGVVLENNIFSQEPKIVELSDTDSYDLRTKSFLRVTIAKGLFGYKVINAREFIK